MASPTIEYELVTGIISPAEFNAGFDGTRETLSVSNDNLQKLKNIMYSNFSKSISDPQGVIVRGKVNGETFVLMQGTAKEDGYHHLITGLVFKDAAGSLAYLYDPEFMTASELAVKSFYNSIGILGRADNVEKPSALYDHKYWHAQQTWSQHSITEEIPAGRKSDTIEFVILKSTYN